MMSEKMILPWTYGRSGKGHLLLASAGLSVAAIEDDRLAG
jgi:hypothetical protein